MSPTAGAPDCTELSGGGLRQRVPCEWLGQGELYQGAEGDLYQGAEGELYQGAEGQLGGGQKERALLQGAGWASREEVLR